MINNNDVNRTDNDNKYHDSKDGKMIRAKC